MGSTINMHPDNKARNGEGAIPTLLEFNDVAVFVRQRREAADYLFVIWVRCINGDKQNVMHAGWQAQYPRERKLLERIINLVNAWKFATRRDDIPSLKDFRTFVIREAEDRGMSDAIHVDQRCLRGNPASIDRRGRSPRDRALLTRILDMLRAFQIARGGQPSDPCPRP